MNPPRLLPLLALVGSLAIVGASDSQDPGVAMNDYLQPYVATQNFWGVAYVARDGKPIFERAYGFANRDTGTRNTLQTRFHIASLSMQLTAAAILRLVDRGSIGLDAPEGRVLSGIPGAESISVRNLLEQRSGLPDINGFANYDRVLSEHQTPQSLVDALAGKPLLFTPGSTYLHEEHSAYNALALLLENTTSEPFDQAMQRVLFGPLGLHDTGVDFDSSGGAAFARGYAPAGVEALEPAASIHWSAKSGNASAFTTAEDEARWVNQLFNGSALSQSSLALVRSTTPPVGYGWFRKRSNRFSETTYYMNGRAPGFSSFLLYLPNERLTVIVLSNIYSSATTAIGYDLAAIASGKPYAPFAPSAEPPAATDLEACSGTFLFGTDFYQPNAKMQCVRNAAELALRWPDGSSSPLIPTGNGRFIDRSYWEPVHFVKDASGKIVAIEYDTFRGARVEE